MQPSDLIYYRVTVQRRPGPANPFIVEPPAGPVRAVRLDHPTKTWTFDPTTVHGRMMDDFDQVRTGSQKWIDAEPSRSPTSWGAHFRAKPSCASFWRTERARRPERPRGRTQRPRTRRRRFHPSGSSVGGFTIVRTTSSELLPGVCGGPGPIQGRPTSSMGHVARRPLK